MPIYIKYNFNKIFNVSLILLILLVLSSCSSLESLKFWDDGEIDLDEPRPLKNIINNENIKINWDISFSGNNSLGNFEPSITSKSIFFADSNGTVSSINKLTGNINWKKQINSLSSGISAGFGILVIADTSGNVICLDQNNGEILWKSNVKGEVLAPAAIDTKVIIIKTGSGELLALARNSGEIVWSYRSKLPILTIRGNSSPVIDGDKIYASFDNGRLGVFEIDSGYPVWDGAISYVTGSSELENLIDSDSKPLVEGGLVYTTNYQGNLNIFDIAQRRSIWQFESSSFYSPLLIKGLIVLIESKSSIKTFSGKNLEQSWESDTYLNRNLSNPISFNGYMIVGDYDGYIHILNPINGKTIGRKKISKKPIKKLISRSTAFYAVDEAFNLFSLSI